MCNEWDELDHVMNEQNLNDLDKDGVYVHIPADIRRTSPLLECDRN